MDILELTDEKEIKRAIELANRTFAKFVAPSYSVRGRKTFRAFLHFKFEMYMTEMKNGEKRLWAVYDGDDMAAMMATRNTTHLCLLFVDEPYMRRGIGRLLTDCLIEMLRGKTDVITVNSSPYAVGFYEHLGFVRTARAKRSEGIVYYPMELVIKDKKDGTD